MLASCISSATRRLSSYKRHRVDEHIAISFVTRRILFTVNTLTLPGLPNTFFLIFVTIHPAMGGLYHMYRIQWMCPGSDPVRSKHRTRVHDSSTEVGGSGREIHAKESGDSTQRHAQCRQNLSIFEGYESTSLLNSLDLAINLSVRCLVCQSSFHNTLRRCLTVDMYNLIQR